MEDQTYVYDSTDLDPFLAGLGVTPDTIRYPTTQEGQHVEISGGHMDAGDYSPYTWNSSLTAWTLITTLDVYGERVMHDNLGGTGIWRRRSRSVAGIPARDQLAQGDAGSGGRRRVWHEQAQGR